MLLPAAALLWLGLSSPAPAATDPSKVLGPEECGECHESAHEVWSATAHARGWTELSRSEEARAIAAALGVRRIKRDERCVSCHFLSAEVEGAPRPIAGVACESCHGAGADWIDPHWDFGPGVSSEDDESPEHRAERLARCDELGMFRPGRIGELAERCYACHVLADAELIAAGHPDPGLFDLAEATQGEMRHNFVRGGGENAPASPGRRALLRVVGRLIDWAATLEALAAAPPESELARSLALRAAELKRLVAEDRAEHGRPELEAALAAAEPAALREAARRLGAAPAGAHFAVLDAAAGE